MNNRNVPLDEKSLKQLNKKVNRDLKLTVEWVSNNKLCLNANKILIKIFKSRNKLIFKHLNCQLHSQKIKQTPCVKYLGVILQKDLCWNKNTPNVGKKSEISHYELKHILSRRNFSVFNSHLIHASKIWGQNQNKTFETSRKSISDN